MEVIFSYSARIAVNCQARCQTKREMMSRPTFKRLLCNKSQSLCNDSIRGVDMLWLGAPHLNVAICWSILCLPLSIEKVSGMDGVLPDAVLVVEEVIKHPKFEVSISFFSLSRSCGSDSLAVFT